jgi:DNA-binding transcriptional ArsR family regulator
MGASRTVDYTNQQNELATIAKALGHPARIAIIEHLLEVGNCVCGEIVNELPLAQPTVSQHLRELKSAGLIQGDVEGNSVCYCINAKTWSRLTKIFNKLFDQYDPAKNCC